MLRREPPTAYFFGRRADGAAVTGWPERVEGLSGAVGAVAAGWKHSLAVTRTGDVYTWGWGLGTGHGAQEVSTARLVKSLALHRALHALRFVQAAGGTDFSLVLSELGTVWSFGGNAEGQLGCPGEEIQPLPRIIPSLNRVKVAEVACGGLHSLARTDTGTVLSWGRGSHGCLGHGDTSSRSTPTRIKVCAFFFVFLLSPLLSPHLFLSAGAL